MTGESRERATAAAFDIEFTTTKWKFSFCFAKRPLDECYMTDFGT